MSGEQQKSSKLVETMIGDIEDVANVPIFTRRSTTQNETTPGISLFLSKHDRQKKNKGELLKTVFFLRKRFGK